MIHEIGMELQAKLAAQGCAFKVLDREATKPTQWRNVIVIDETGDTYGPVRSPGGNPRRFFTGNVGAKLTVYAQSTKSGAAEYEHRRAARRVVDLALVALRTIRAERKTGLTIGAGAFVPIDDLEKSERPGGVAYELAFTVERGIFDTTFAGAAFEEADLAIVEMSGTPTLTFANVGATGDTITRSTGSWVDDGFAIGMSIRVTGSVSNNVTATIATVAATILTLGATALTDEGPVSDCTVTAGGITSTTLVSAATGPDDDDDTSTPPATAEIACGA